ncbi:hypothetical protein [Henriciella sp.]|uniref:hypothetical protein n=1 Tax=Henriciella sp. TaxID=1968823 RepID=UPI0026260670|nr:hypothetical protein [Henriciella sp.]
MKLLFSREQTAHAVGRVTFKLWGKIELDEQEQALMKRYRFDDSILIAEDQPNLIRNSGLLGALAGLVALVLFNAMMPMDLAFLLAIGAFGGVAYWFYNEKRETIYVRDLLHGRHFACKTVIALAKKEAWLQSVVAFLRQVMESAKHWDGQEIIAIEALPKEEARQLILKAG